MLKALYVLLAIALCAPLALAQSPPQSKPNIVFMLADNLGYGMPSSYNGEQEEDGMSALAGHRQLLGATRPDAAQAYAHSLRRVSAESSQAVALVTRIHDGQILPHRVGTAIDVGEWRS